MIEMVNGDARGIPLADGVVQCVVTSPPYWGLRDYGVEGQIGLERTPEEYVGHLVEVFREVRRVLRGDGTVWLNLGDCYAREGGSQSGDNRELLHMNGIQKRMCKVPDGCDLKPKDLVGIPWMVAFALRADGWWLRSEVIWHKPNPMPESVTDRPTKSHEQVFLLSKRADYFYDADAIREPHICASDKRNDGKRHPYSDDAKHSQVDPNRQRTKTDCVSFHPAGRNMRSVWTVATQSYSGAHFATFPEKLVEPCVLAGTSARGACPRCGAGWVRVMEREFQPMTDRSPEKLVRSSGQKGIDSSRHDHETPRGYVNVTTTGWRPGCECEAGEPVPQFVLDPFAGTGTVGRVCARHGRRFVGVELKGEYIELARGRTSGVQMVMGG
jgi:DNA modification methylase